MLECSVFFFYLNGRYKKGQLMENMAHIITTQSLTQSFDRIIEDNIEEDFCFLNDRTFFLIVQDRF